MLPDDFNEYEYIISTHVKYYKDEIKVNHFMLYKNIILKIYLNSDSCDYETYMIKDDTTNGYTIESMEFEIFDKIDYDFDEVKEYFDKLKQIKIEDKLDNIKKIIFNRYKTNTRKHKIKKLNIK